MTPATVNGSSAAPATVRAHSFPRFARVVRCSLQVFGEEGRLYVDNQVALSDEVLGTRYIKVPPGETKVQLLVSSFSEIKRATAEIKEAFS